MTRTGKTMAMALLLLTPVLSAEAHMNDGSGHEFVEGSGWARKAGQKVHFGIAAVCRNGVYEGHFQYKDKSLGMRIKEAEVFAVSRDGEVRIIEGVAVVEGVSALPGSNDGNEVGFRVGVVDDGHQGRNKDSIWVEFDSGYFFPETLLSGGNIRLHQHPGDNGCANTQPDSTPPSVNISSPEDGASVSGAVSITANASDDTDVAGVQFLVDGTAIGAEDTSAPYAVTWDSNSVSNGGHTLTAVARDGAGNTATAGVSVTVNNDGGSGAQVRIEENDPAVAYTGAWLAINDTRASEGRVVESNEAGATAVLSFEGTGVTWIGFRCSCAAGIANLYVDGTFVDSVDAHGTNEPVQDEIYSVSGLPDGQHTFTIEITGDYNREGNSAYVIIDAFDIEQ